MLLMQVSFAAGNTSQPLIAGSPVGSDAAVEQQKTKSTQHPIVEEHAQAAVEHSLLKSPEPGAAKPPVLRLHQPALITGHAYRCPKSLLEGLQTVYEHPHTHTPVYRGRAQLSQ